jgi:hypothetical protein
MNPILPILTFIRRKTRRLAPSLKPLAAIITLTLPFASQDAKAQSIFHTYNTGSITHILQTQDNGFLLLDTAYNTTQAIKTDSTGASHRQHFFD